MLFCFSVIVELPEPVETSTGHSGGFDFGLKTFLTDHKGHEYHSPQFLKAELNQIARLNRTLSRKQKGSSNWHKAKRPAVPTPGWPCAYSGQRPGLCRVRRRKRLPSDSWTTSTLSLLDPENPTASELRSDLAVGVRQGEQR